MKVRFLSLLLVSVLAVGLTHTFVSAVKADCSANTDDSDNSVSCDDDSGNAIKTHDGNDTVTVDNDSSVNYVNSGDDNDTITFNNDSGAGTVKGDDGNDSISFSNDSGADYVNGGHGDDSISFNDGGAGTVVGGSGDDTITVANDSDVDYINGDSHHSHHGGDDSITVDDSEVGYIDGGKGDDTVKVNDAYVGAVEGGKGDDSISVHDSLVQYIDGGKGDDTISVNDAGVFVIGDKHGWHTGDDLITIKNGAEVGKVFAGDGNDTINIGADVGYVDAGKGEDVVQLDDDAAAHFLNGGKGYDVLQFKFTVDSKEQKDAFQKLVDSQQGSYYGMITFGGKTFRWISFEQLQNLLKIAQDSGNSDVTVSVLGDTRLNHQDPAAPIAVYCTGGHIEVWTIGSDGNGTKQLDTVVAALPASNAGINVALNGDQVTTTYGGYSYSFDAAICPG